MTRNLKINVNALLSTPYPAFVSFRLLLHIAILSAPPPPDGERRSCTEEADVMVVEMQVMEITKHT